MSVENALIAHASPQMMLAKIQHLVQHEQNKGCTPGLLSAPVAIEPHYQPIGNIRDLLASSATPHHVFEVPAAPSEMLRRQVWLAPDYEMDWRRSELFLKLLSRVSRRMAMEIVGNCDCIYMDILAHQDDWPAVTAAFRGEFGQCGLAPLDRDLMASISVSNWTQIALHDYYPPSRYISPLTCNDELRISPFEPLIAAIAEVPPSALAVHQVVFQPVAPDHAWHVNIRVMQDWEYLARQYSNGAGGPRYAQQAPAGNLPDMSRELREKAHNDKPLFAVALRVAILGDELRGPSLLSATSMVGNLFQHGGMRLAYLAERDYATVLDVHQIPGMLLGGITYRPGFLLNSEELSGLVHMPPASILEPRRPPMKTLRSLSMAPPVLTSGMPIGQCGHPEHSEQICLPRLPTPYHIHMIGKARKGKSKLMEQMILYELGQGEGGIVIDPHGELVQGLLDAIPVEHAHRVIYFRPADREYVPLWNPMTVPPGCDESYVANNLVAAFKSFVSGWGHRLEYVLDSSIRALLCLPGSTLFDVSNLMRKKSKERRDLLAQLRDRVGEGPLKQFISHDLTDYGRTDLSPVQHKLGLLLAGGPVSRMLCQSTNRIDLRRIMDSGQLLLVDLTGMPASHCNTLGSLLLGMVYSHAVGRSDLPAEDRLPFHFYVDEAGRFISDAIDHIMSESLKFGVNLVLAHHRTSEFDRKQADALASAEASIIFNVDKNTAESLVPDLQDRVSVTDLIRLEPFEAILRWDTEIVRFKTRKPLVEAASCRDRIISESRRLYYRRIHQPAVDDTPGSEEASHHGGVTEPKDVASCPEDLCYDDGF